MRKRKKDEVPRGHRLRAGAVRVHKVRRHRKFSVLVVIIAGGVLTVCVYFGVHDGTLHHLALAVLAERLALGLGGGGEEE